MSKYNLRNAQAFLMVILLIQALLPFLLGILPVLTVFETNTDYNISEIGYLLLFIDFIIAIITITTILILQYIIRSKESEINE